MRRALSQHLRKGSKPYGGKTLGTGRYAAMWFQVAGMKPVVVRRV